MPLPNTQYKTVGVQWFAGVWFALQLFPRWIRTKPENPTVSYYQPLGEINDPFEKKSFAQMIFR